MESDYNGQVDINLLSHTEKYLKISAMMKFKTINQINYTMVNLSNQRKKSSPATCCEYSDMQFFLRILMLNQNPDCKKNFFLLAKLCNIESILLLIKPFHIHPYLHRERL